MPFFPLKKRRRVIDTARNREKRLLHPASDFEHSPQTTSRSWHSTLPGCHRYEILFVPVLFGSTYSQQNRYRNPRFGDERIQNLYLLALSLRRALIDFLERPGDLLPFRRTSPRHSNRRKAV